MAQTTATSGVLTGEQILWIPAGVLKREEEAISTPRNSEPQTESNSEKAWEELKLADATRKSMEEKFNKPLSQELRESMQSIHKITRQNPILNQFITGEFKAETILEYLCCLYVIHEALENAQISLEKKYGSKCFVYPELYRFPHIKKDIKDWAELNPSQEFAKKCLNEDLHGLAKEPAKKMAQHINELAESDPIGVIGILYALYGGILSGGQAIKEGVKKCYQTCAINAHKSSDETSGCASFSYDFNTAEFRKMTWQPNLDNVLNVAKIEKKEECIENLKKETRFAFQNELDFLAQITV